jgi:hypothetical protein
MFSRIVGNRLSSVLLYVAILVVGSPALAQPPTYQQPFVVSYSVVSDLNLDSACMQSWVDVTLRLVDSMPQSAVRLMCYNGISMDSLLVDGVRIDRASIDSAWSPGYRYELTTPVAPPMTPGQSRVISLACHIKLRKRDVDKKFYPLPGSLPIVVWRKRNPPGVVSSGDGTRLCRADFECRLTVTPPILAVGEGELLNEAEFIMVSSRPRDTVLTDLIPEERFGRTSTKAETAGGHRVCNYLFRCEGLSEFGIILLRGYTLDRTWVGDTPIDLYYPRKSKKRWAGWAVRTIADAVKANRDEGEPGPNPIRFVVGGIKYYPGPLGASLIPDKKFSAANLWTFVSHCLP